MAIVPSIHDKKRDAIVETLQETRAERSIETTLDINIELYSAGFFDGLTGLDAEHRLNFRQIENLKIRTKLWQQLVE